MKKTYKKIFRLLFATVITVSLLMKFNVHAEPEKNDLNIIFSKENEDKELKEIKLEGIGISVWDLSEYSSIKNDSTNSYSKEDKLKELRLDLDKISTKDLEKELGRPFYTGKIKSDDTLLIKDIEDNYYYIRQIDNNDKIVISSTVLKFPIETFKMVDVKKVFEIRPKKEMIKDEPEVNPDPKLGGHKFVKTDNSPKANYLEGAKFIVSKKVNGYFENVKKDGKDLVLVSDKNGEFEVKDLPLGTYYLTETQAPKLGDVQYSILTQPVSFEITKDSYDSNKAINIIDKPVNTTGINIPYTGNIQIYIYSFLGIMLMIMGILIYRDGRKSFEKVKN